MNRCKSRSWAALAVVLFLLGGACSSTKSATSGDEAQKHIDNPEFEVENYLVGDGADIVLKVRVEDWNRIRPLIEDLLTTPGADQEGTKSGALVDAAQSGLPAFASEVTGFDLRLEHLAPDRPAYMVFDPRRHSPNQACLSAGLPCVLFDSPGPRYGRLILPTESPPKLADELEEVLGDATYRIVEHDYHVRVEFATGSKPEERVQEHLQDRVQDEPEDDHWERLSPARQRVLSSETSFGIYLDLRAAVDGARYLEQWYLAERLSEYSSSARMQKLLGWTAGITQLAKLDMAERAEVEDVALVLDGDGESYALDAVYTQTRKGRKLAEAAAFETELPQMTISSPSLRLDWSVRLDNVVERTSNVQWWREMGATPETRSPLIVNWVWIGAFRAPSSISGTAIRAVQNRLGMNDLSSVVAGRVRFATPEGSGSTSSSWKNLPSGIVLLLSPGSAESNFVRRMKAYADGNDRVRLQTREREDGFVEVRLARNAKLEEIFEDERTPVESFEFVASDDVVRRATSGIDRGTAATGALPARIVAGIGDKGGLSVARNSGDGWVSFRVGFGRADVTAPSFEAVDYDLIQPEERCMENVAVRFQKLIESALASEKPDAHLAERFSTEIGAMRNELSDCGKGGEAESDFSNWASNYVDAWYSLVLYRSGAENWAKRILQVCEDGHEWACGPEEGKWPWVRASN